MSDSNDADGRPAPGNAPDGGPSPDAGGGGANGMVRMWLDGALFVVAAAATFVAGDDNRRISIPAAIVAAVALVDLLSVSQRNTE